MRLPIYRLVTFTSSKLPEVTDQLRQLEWGQVPYALDLRGLEDQLHALELIEDYVSEKQISLIPYPAVVLAKGLASDLLDVCESLQKAPQFYNQKIKALNNREQDALTELELRQKNLSNIKPEIYVPALKKYSLAHRRVFEAARENYFYEQLLLLDKDKK